MKIGNVRLGLATNSSSTHYIILLNNKKHKYGDADCHGQNFGWQEFTCASKLKKMQYLSQSIYKNLTYEVGEVYAKIIVGAWLENNEILDTDGYIDHQSDISFPKLDEKYSKNKHMNFEFLNDFKEFLCRDDVIIIGGNDNEDHFHEAHLESNAIICNTNDFSANAQSSACRKDGSVWYLFNKFNGTRFSLSFDENIKDFRPSVPLLVDIKITDQCKSGCSFCYQNSSPKGEHATIQNINLLSAALDELKVFEIAIGGGEPTEHPHFCEIIYSSNNFVKNFSTRNSYATKEFLAGLSDLEKEPHIISSGLAAYRIKNGIKKRYGACALTIDSEHDVKRIVESLPKTARNKLAFHYVMGTSNEETYKNILQACSVFDVPIVLLGYKHFGRGVTYKPAPYDNWLKIAQSVGGHVGIDTALAREYEEELKEEKISTLTYSTEETDTSMYIDAVTMKMGPSSYCDPSEMIPLKMDEISIWNPDHITNLSEQIKNAFKLFRDKNEKTFTLKAEPLCWNPIPASKLFNGTTKAYQDWSAKEEEDE